MRGAVPGPPRRATAADAAALVDLRIEFMRIVKDGGLPDEEEWRRELAGLFARDLGSGDLVAWVFEEGGRMVATSGLAFPADPEARVELGLGPGEALLCNMYTVPERRRRGLASALLELELEEARSLGASDIRLQPTPESRRLYETRGFSPEGEGGDLLLRL